LLATRAGAGGSLRVSRRRLAGHAVGIVGVVFMLYGIGFWFASGGGPGDAMTYQLAGERLNSGGSLYDLRPTDPWHADEASRAFPLLSPPLIGVIWRVLAAAPIGIALWWAAMASCVAWAILVLLRRTSGWAGAGVALLLLPMTLMTGVGNVDCAVLAACVAIWLLYERGNQPIVGILVGVMASLKLTPSALLVWLLASRQWRAVVWCGGTIAVLMLVVLVGAGPDVFARYGRVVLEYGSSNPLARLFIVCDLLLVLLLGRRALSFSFAVVAMPFGAAWTHSWAVAVASLAPWTSRAWEATTEHAATSVSGSDLEPIAAHMRGEERRLPA
jgi:hypothetical protein